MRSMPFSRNNIQSHAKVLPSVRQRTGSERRQEADQAGEAMKITKWVDMGAEVTVEIDSNDIRSAIAEAFENVTADRLGEEKPTAKDVLRAINDIAAFLNAVSDPQISMMTFGQRLTIEKFLREHADRFKLPADVTA